MINFMVEDILINERSLSHAFINPNTMLYLIYAQMLHLSIKSNAVIKNV